jgi:hypothetical protein
MTIDDVLPEEPTGELVHWMDAGLYRLASPKLTAGAAFAIGVAAGVGGYLLWRYLAPRRDALPPWRWRRGSIH